VQPTEHIAYPKLWQESASLGTP